MNAPVSQPCLRVLADSIAFAIFADDWLRIGPIGDERLSANENLRSKDETNRVRIYSGRCISIGQISRWSLDFLCAVDLRVVVVERPLSLLRKRVLDR